jgi:lysozyme
MNTLTSERNRVISAISLKLNTLSNEKLDDFARELMGLPKRPQGDEPFVGWLLAEATVNQSTTVMCTSTKGIELIKQFEGYRSKAYLCPASKWTIGYGHTRTVKQGMVISKDEGERLLKQDLRVYENAVNELVEVPLTQNQFDALTSFTYNVGRGAFHGSTLLSYLNQRNYIEAANQLLRWTKGNGQGLPGLIRRREAEKKLFLS